MRFMCTSHDRSIDVDNLYHLSLRLPPFTWSESNGFQSSGSPSIVVQSNGPQSIGLQSIRAEIIGSPLLGVPIHQVPSRRFPIHWGVCGPWVESGGIPGPADGLRAPGRSTRGRKRLGIESARAGVGDKFRILLEIKIYHYHPLPRCRGESILLEKPDYRMGGRWAAGRPGLQSPPARICKSLPRASAWGHSRTGCGLGYVSTRT